VRKVPYSDPAKLSLLARQEILRMTSKSGASHVGSALSVVDILSELYSGFANINKSNVRDSQRDVVIVSKGHAAAALYSILALQDFFPLDWLEGYCQDNGFLGGHVTSKGIPGVELSTGSLGHGFPYAVGIALSRKLSGLTGEVYVVMSDGECDEGTTWESAMLANHHELKNLTVIVDRNRIQSLGDTEDTLKLEPFGAKWKAFGWRVEEIDGHNFIDLERALSAREGPKCIIANTTKGKGVNFMENSVLWHYKSPNPSELEDALSQVADS
jgi:transketolase